MYELIAGQPLLDVNGLEGYQARIAALHTMDLQVSCRVNKAGHTLKHRASMDAPVLMPCKWSCSEWKHRLAGSSLPW